MKLIQKIGSLLVLMLFVTSASATQYQGYLDTDSDNSGQCSANGFSGFDHRLQVALTGNTIDDITLAGCQNNQFGTPKSIKDLSGVQSTFNATTKTVELCFPKNLLNSQGSPFNPANATAIPGLTPWAMLLLFLGLTVIIYRSGFLQRHKHLAIVIGLPLVATLALAATIVVDGETDDWNGISFSTNQNDNVALCQTVEGDKLCIRMELARSLKAVNDDFSASPLSTTGGATETVLTNDTVDGSAATGSVTASIVSDGGLSGVSMDASTGIITVLAGVTAGTYNVEYQICETIIPSNCTTATATIVVEAPVPVIVAVDDDFSASPIFTTGGATATVLTNDTVDGNAATGSVTVSIVSDGGLAGVSIDAITGIITVPAGVTAGTYNVEYQICETITPGNCTTATATIVVEAPVPVIVAVDDDFSASPIFTTGGATATVLTNDTVDGNTAAGSVTASIVSDGGLSGVSIDASTGIITVPAGTVAGTYEVEYQICETITPGNCTTATATIVVVQVIVANDDGFNENYDWEEGIGLDAYLNSGYETILPSVFLNDTIDDNSFDNDQVILTKLEDSAADKGFPLAYGIDADGNRNGEFIIPRNQYEDGLYEEYVKYRICLVTDTNNCSEAIVRYVVIFP